MEKLLNFLKEARAELGKSTWLSRAQVIQSTILVFVIVILVSAYINAVDFGLTRILKFVIGGGR